MCVCVYFCSFAALHISLMYKRLTESLVLALYLATVRDYQDPPSSASPADLVCLGARLIIPVVIKYCNKNKEGRVCLWLVAQGYDAGTS